MMELGYVGFVFVCLGLAIVLPGCGGGAGSSGEAAGPNPEVKVVQPVDANGNVMSPEDELKGKPVK